ncbi:MAG: hypothetical protein OCD02_14955 [Spirochaetaceae bacterium]
MKTGIIILENDEIRVEVLPSRGGKISSIFNKSKKCEWLYQDSSKDNKESIPSVFGKTDAFGFDEMFPTINREIIPGILNKPIELPDHGELWSKKWTVIDSDNTSLGMAVKGELLPYIFKRKIQLLSNEIHIHYSVENLSSVSLPSLWTPHPLFSFFEDTKVLLPKGLKSIRQAMNGGILGSLNRVHDTDGSGVIEKSVPLFKPFNLPANSCFKFYSGEPLQEGYCGLKDKRGTLEMIFSETSLPWLGFWINNGGWNNQYNIALEPATAPMDSPGASEKQGVESTLKPYQKKVWNLNIVLS